MRGGGRVTMADWQQIIALILVACAAAYLARSLWRRGTGQGATACGTCRTCPAKDDRQSDGDLPLVDIETVVPSRDRSEPSDRA
jgi:hypothetical protein